MKKCLMLGLLLTQFGCSVAPTQSYHSASSLGSGKNEVKLNSIAPGLSYDRGVLQNLDIGAGVEMQGGLVFNARTKYALINNKRGLAVSVFGGGGISDDLGNAKSAYAGPIVSYRTDHFELFTSFRYNHVNWNNELSSSERSDIFDFIPHKYNFTYRQLDVGMTFHGQSGFFTVGARAFFLGDEEDVSPILDFGLHF